MHTGGTPRRTVPRRSSGRATTAPPLPIEPLSGSEVTVFSLGRDRRSGPDGQRLGRAARRSARCFAASAMPLLRVQPRSSRSTVASAPGGTSTARGVGRTPRASASSGAGTTRRRFSSPGFLMLDRKQGVLEVSEHEQPDDVDEWLVLQERCPDRIPEGGEIHYAAGATTGSIPARTATEDVEWPQAGGGPQARPPVGIDDGYVPLAFVNATGDVKEMEIVDPAGRQAGAIAGRGPMSRGARAGACQPPWTSAAPAPSLCQKSFRLCHDERARSAGLQKWARLRAQARLLTRQ